MKLLLGILLPLLGVMGIWGLASRATNVVAAQEPTETPLGEAAVETAVDPRFGVVESFWEPAEAADLQVGWDRILFLWHEIQPTGPDDWNTLHVLEEWLVDAQMNGRTVVGLLKSTPPWAADGEPYAGVPQGLYLPIDDPGNLWAVYLRRVAEYYGARGVHHWIVWNEPDIPADVYGHEFGGSMEDYYRLVQVAYLVMKDADPEAVIHLGALTYWHDPTFLRRFLTMIAADPTAAANNYYFDVLSLHIYFRPETIPDIITEAADIQQEVGIDPPKPIWMNETNARPSMDPEWPVEVQQFHLDLEQQAWYVPQAFALAFASGAERASFYKLIDIHLPPGGESWGLLRPDKSRRPAYRAYQVMVQELGGFVGPVTMQETAVLTATGRPAYTQVTFPMPDGAVRVLWANGPTAVMLDVPALAAAGELVGHMGHRQEVTAVDGAYTITLEGGKCYQRECDIGGPPVYLVERGETLAALATVPAIYTPLAVATITPTPEVPNTPTPVDTPSPTPSSTPTITPSPTTTATPTATSTATATATATLTPAPTATQPPAPTVPVEAAGSSLSASLPVYVLGAVFGLALLLAGGVIWQRRQKD